MPKIHPSSIVEDGAVLAEDVEVGPFCYVGPNVTLGAGTKLISHCNVTGYTTLGAGNTVFSGASLGTAPQDYSYDPNTISYLKIADNNIFREGFTANPGTKEGTETLIGSNNFFMVNTHVAHNCKIGNRVIMVNGAPAGGYVELHDNCIISSPSPIHQFCRIGRFAMLGGSSSMNKDLPPFMIAAGVPGRVKGLNLVGLRRNNFSQDAIRAIKAMYKIFFRSGMNFSKALHRIENELPPLPEVKEFCEFVKTSNRGICAGPRG